MMRQLKRSDEGVTLIEMVVVIAILSGVLAMVMTVIIAAQKNVNGNSARLDQIQQGKVAMESMSKTLRTAVRPSQLNATCTGCDQAAFLQGNARSVQFYANINNPANILGPSRVSYTVDNAGVLTETLQAPNPHAATDYNYQYCTPGPGCTVISRVLARGVSLSKTMFTYYDASNNTFSTLPLASTDLPRVDSIDIIVNVSSSAQVSSTTFTQRVTLPNADAVQQTAVPTP
jgi:prepilin-type N-terminal cleavage/methylation domain-containing protein